METGPILSLNNVSLLKGCHINETTLAVTEQCSATWASELQGARHTSCTHTHPEQQQTKKEGKESELC